MKKNNLFTPLKFLKWTLKFLKWTPKIKNFGLVI